MTHPTPLTPKTRSRLVIWRIGQILGVAVTVLLIAGFFWRADTALNILWNVLIPILPATFLITPALWRGLCPLATLNTLPNGLFSRKNLSTRALPMVGAVGIALLVVLVPARRFLFNDNGTALAIVVILVAVAAFCLGTVFDLKAGFCNAICPVLPVEKLYGQHPLLNVSNPRCLPCTLCTPKGCLDLASTKTLTQTLGPSHHSHAWLKTIYGAFAAAFPGFIVGYYTTTDVPLSAAGSVYLHVALWAAGSYLVTALLVLGLNVQAKHALPVLAAAAVGIYYWFAAPIVSDAIGTAAAGAVVIRVTMLVLVGVWLWRTLLHTRRAPSGPPEGTVPAALPGGVATR